MVKIVDVKDCGKTKKLLAECAKTNGVFICKHPERIQDKCIAYNLPLVEACHYDEAYKHMKLDCWDFDTVPDRNIYIDELEEFVNRVIPNLKGYSMSYEKEEKEI